MRRCQIALLPSLIMPPFPDLLYLPATLNLIFHPLHHNCISTGYYELYLFITFNFNFFPVTSYCNISALLKDLDSVALCLICDLCLTIRTSLPATRYLFFFSFGLHVISMFVCLCLLTFYFTTLLPSFTHFRFLFFVLLHLF